MEQNHKAIENHLDFPKMFQEIKLRLRTEDFDSLIPFESERMVSDLLSGGKILYTGKKDKVIAFVYVEDKENHCLYPLFFLPVRYDSQGFFLEHLFLRFNPLAIQFLQGFGIQEKENISGKMISSYLSFLEEQIQGKLISDRIGIRYGYRFYHDRVMICLNLYPLLNQFLMDNKVEKKYLGLIKEVKEEEVEKQIESENVGCFVKINRAKKRLSLYEATKISYQGRDVLKGTFYSFLNSFFSHGENVLLIVPDAEKEAVIQTLQKRKLTPYLFDYENYSEEKEIPDCSFDEDVISFQEKENIESFDQCQERFLSFIEKRDECYKPLTRLFDDSLYAFLQEHVLDDVYLPPLDIQDYQKEDLEKDLEVLASLKEKKTLFARPLDQNPFYGLTSSSEKENYDAFLSVIQAFQERLSTFMDVLSKSKIFTVNGEEIDSFEKVEQILSAYHILSGYNGFPRKYFRLAEENQAESLYELKRSYQSLSSAKMTLEQIFTKEIYKEDFTSLLNMAHSDKFFQKLKVKRILSRYRKNPKNKRFDLMIEVLEIHQRAKDHLEEILPQYREIYGENVNTMNGVVEIESNIKYVNHFHSYFKDHPTFSLSNPFIKRYLKEKDFRLLINKETEEISSLYEKVEESILLFYQFFSQKLRDLSSMTFEEVKFLLDKLSSESYESFEQYSSFKLELDSSSLLLQMTIRNYVRKGIPLDGIEISYPLSIILSFYEKGEEKFKPYHDSYLSVRSEYYQRMRNIEKVESSRQVLNLIEVFQKKEKRERELSYPIGICPISSLWRMPDVVYDHVILFDTGFFNSIELLTSYQFGKDVLILNDRTLYDIRTQGYHETLLNKEVMYRGLFHYERVDKSLFDVLPLHAEIQSDDRYPYIYTENDTSFALLPDIILDHNQDNRYLLELSMFLSREEHLVLVIFDTISLILGKRKTITPKDDGK